MPMPRVPSWASGSGSTSSLRCAIPERQLPHHRGVLEASQQGGRERQLECARRMRRGLPRTGCIAQLPNPWCASAPARHQHIRCAPHFAPHRKVQSPPAAQPPRAAWCTTWCGLRATAPQTPCQRRRTAWARSSGGTHQVQDEVGRCTGCWRLHRWHPVQRHEAVCAGTHSLHAPAPA